MSRRAMRESLTGHCRRINCRQTIDLPGSVRRVGTSTEASDPAGMSHLRNVRARQPRRRCVRSGAGRRAAHVRVVLSLAPVRGPGYNASRTNDVPTAERAGSDAREVACAAEAAERATVHPLQRRPTMNREPAQRSAQAPRPARTETRQALSGTARRRVRAGL